MSSYVDIIILGLLVFPLLAALLTFPYALVQYHRYGSVSRLRTLVVYSFVLYLLIAYFLVTLPLPDPESTVGNRWQDHLSLVPFGGIRIWWAGQQVNATTMRGFARSFALWQVLFNVLLTVPFGVYLRYYFKQGLWRTVALTLVLSLFFELTQLSALYGICPGPYRLAATEDLITNTLGGVLGWQIAYVFMLVLPNRDAIDAHSREAGRTVTGKRRFWAALFDFMACDVLFFFMRGALYEALPVATGLLDRGWGVWTLLCAASLLQVLVTRGMTLGHAICRMTLVSKDGRPARWWRLIWRYVLLWLLTEGPLVAVIWLTESPYAGNLSRYVLLGLMLTPALYPCAYFLNEFLRGGAHPMPHDTLSGTRYAAIEVTAD